MTLSSPEKVYSFSTKVIFSQSLTLSEGSGVTVFQDYSLYVIYFSLRLLKYFNFVLHNNGTQEFI